MKFKCCSNPKLQTDMRLRRKRSPSSWLIIIKKSTFLYVCPPHTTYRKMTTSTGIHLYLCQGQCCGGALQMDGPAAAMLWSGASASSFSPYRHSPSPRSSRSPSPAPGPCSQCGYCETCAALHASLDSGYVEGESETELPLQARLPTSGHIKSADPTARPGHLQSAAQPSSPQQASAAQCPSPGPPGRLLRHRSVSGSPLVFLKIPSLFPDFPNFLLHPPRPTIPSVMPTTLTQTWVRVHQDSHFLPFYNRLH